MRCVLFAVWIVVVACLGAENVVEPIGEADILFIGNSLTATNDLPELVQAIARADGRTITYRAATGPNLSLEDHWYLGVADVIAEAKADVVVLQQGPSSLPENQEYLRVWTVQLAAPIRAAGGSPALFMVWPEATRPEAFDAVRDAYAGAAQAVDGLFIPAGEAWRAVWERYPDAPLYSADGFHPSQMGSLVAALTIYAVVYDVDVTALPVAALADVPAQYRDFVVAGVAQAVLAGAPNAP